MASKPPTPTSNGNNPAPTHGPSNADFRVVRKRNRIPLSCAPCRNRKLKCNRSHPCENCVKRGDASSCSYASPNERRKSRSSGSSTPDDMQNRIDRLENLVLTMMSSNGASDASPTTAAINRSMSMSTSTGSGGSQEIHTPSRSEEPYHEDEEGESETDKVANSFGVLHMTNNKAAYLGEAHWASILNDISEVKNYFVDHKKQYDEMYGKVESDKKASNMTSTGPAFILGVRDPPKLSELLAGLPGRDATDKLVQRYFNVFDKTTHILHTPSWNREYEQYWTNPENSSPVFLAQILALCGLAMQSYDRDGDEPLEYRGRSLNYAHHYRMLTKQCMLLFDIQKVEHAIVEVYVLHLQSEFYKAAEADVGVWILLGIVVRLAMRMGLHRDAQHYPNLSVFQGEMRRRIWTFIRLADVLFSFQVGLPNMIRSSDCDAELPLNLHDNDFDEFTETMPPSRPSNIVTNTSYMVGTASLAIILGHIVECVHSVNPPTYDEIMRLDRELLGSYHRLPSVMHMKPLEECALDEPSTIMSRFDISVLFNKSVCVLHRKFLQRARDNSRYAHSRRSCVDAAMTILRHQVVLHAESQPSHRLQRAYRSASAFLKHDFILAGTLVCLDLLLSAQLEAMGRPTGDMDIWGRDCRDDMLHMIEQSRAIWAESKDRVMEAFKAHEIMGVMLQKITTLRAQTAARQAQSAFALAGGTSSAAISESPRGYGRPSEGEKPEQAAALTLGMLSSGGLAGKPGNNYGGTYPATSSSNGNPGLRTDTPVATAPSPSFGINSTVNGNFSAGGQGNLPFLNTTDFDMPANFDWTALDSYISNSNVPNDLWPQSMDMSAAPSMDANTPIGPVPSDLDPALPQYNPPMFQGNAQTMFPNGGSSI